MKDNFNETMKFEPPKDNVNSAKDIILSVFASLQEKGYDPINQIIGYILSGDPTYITSYNEARSMITRIERDELLEELLRAYLPNEK